MTDKVANTTDPFSVVWRDHKTDTPHTQTEYTRKDISNAKDKRIEELEAKLARTIGYKEDYAAAFVSVTGKLQQQGDRCEELEAKLATATNGLRKCEEEIDGYIRQEYPHDHPVQERYRQRDFAANPARTTLAELKGPEA